MTRTLLLTILLFCVHHAPAVRASARAGGVRASGGDVTRVLTHAAAASTTVRRMLDELADSDVIVHVERTATLGAGIAGATHFVTAAGGYRYLRVRLVTALLPDNVAAVLAHELQHALEVARAPSVVDERGFERLYLEIGEACGGGWPSRRYDTGAARAVGALAAREIRASARAGARRP